MMRKQPHPRQRGLHDERSLRVVMKMAARVVGVFFNDGVVHILVAHGGDQRLVVELYILNKRDRRVASSQLRQAWMGENSRADDHALRVQFGQRFRRKFLRRIEQHPSAFVIARLGRQLGRAQVVCRHAHHHHVHLVTQQREPCRVRRGERFQLQREPLRFGKRAHQIVFQPRRFTVRVSVENGRMHHHRCAQLGCAWWRCDRRVLGEADASFHPRRELERQQQSGRSNQHGQDYAEDHNTGRKGRAFSNMGCRVYGPTIIVDGGSPRMSNL